MATIVIIPGGYHPYHAGHAALYQSAQRAFPDAEVFVAATNDTSTRPFPFPVKEKLARLAGVEPGHFVQVKSPFRAEEITAGFDPARDTLIFVRSEKDSTKPPQAGGVKRDGSLAYLQPLLGAKKLEPFSKHAYMAYLPTVEFGPGMTSATEIRSAWPRLDERRKTALVMSLYPKTQTNPQLAQTVVKILDAAIGTQSVTEGSESSIQKKIQAKQDSLSLAREQRRARGQRQQGPREIKLQAEIDKLNTELTQLKRQGVAEGLSKRDQKDVAAIQAAIERLQAQLKQPNADRAAIQQSIEHERKRLALYGQGVAEGSDQNGWYVLDTKNRKIIANDVSRDRAIAIAKSGGYSVWQTENGTFINSTKTVRYPGLGWIDVSERVANKNEQGVAEGSLGQAMPWPEIVNKINSAMKAMGWKGRQQDDNSFMFSTKGQEVDDQWYIAIIENTGNNFFTYALGTVEEDSPYIGEQNSLPMTAASVSELMNSIREGFGLNEGAPIVVTPRADRLKKPEPTKVRYQGDIVPPTKPPSTEKRGVKGRPGQRPMPGVAEAEKKCPPATQDIALNLQNRQKAIDEYGYGPLNPDLPNSKFWMKKVNEWNLDSMEEAQQSLCGNCAAFDIRQDTLDCIAQGIDSDAPEDAEGVIDAGDLGYCKFLKFKCASRRTCDAWVTGGPLRDKAVEENQGWAATLESDQVDVATDPELVHARRFAKQHYPEFSGDEDLAFAKWVQRGLGHSEKNDREHDRKLKQLTARVAMLQAALEQQAKNSDYIEESSRKK